MFCYITFELLIKDPIKVCDDKVEARETPKDRSEFMSFQCQNE